MADTEWSRLERLEAENGLLRDENVRLCQRLRRYEEWVQDLQSGMYINCVYCGHRYGPDNEVPAAMADVLKAHIEVCPEHPLSKAMARIAELEAAQGK